MTQITLGKGATLDLESLIKTKLLVQANSGGGKSWAIRRILEQSHGRLQHIVIDPEGEFASLREKYDYVLAAPQGGDTTAEPRYAKLLAHRLLELGASAIIDIYELEPFNRIKFVRLFAEALVNAPKSLWHPCLVVLDEAHNFCPQTGEAESSRPLMGLASKGRKRGFALVAATQRIAKLHKDFAAECNNKMIGRSALDVDMKRAAEELGWPSSQQQELRRLAPGEFWVFGPAIGYEVKRITVGPVITSHPEVGSVFAAPAPTAKIRALLPKLSDLPAEAESEARDNESLRRELAEARRKLMLAEKERPPCDHEPEIASLNSRLVEANDVLDAERSGRLFAYAAMKDAVGVLERALPEIEPSKVKKLMPKVESVGFTSTRPPAIKSSGTNGRHADLDGPERRVVNAIAWFESIGIDSPAQQAVCFVAGYSWGGGFFKPRGSLNKMGMTEIVGNTIRLTDAGRDAADAPDAPASTAALHEMVLAKLDGPERRVLAPLLDVYPDAMPQQENCERAGYSWGGGYFKPRGRLRSWGLIEFASDGVRATDVLFPEGVHGRA